MTEAPGQLEIRCELCGRDFVTYGRIKVIKDRLGEETGERQELPQETLCEGCRGENDGEIMGEEVTDE